MSLQLCEMRALKSPNTAANLVWNIFWEGRPRWRWSSLTDNTIGAWNSRSIKAASTPRGPVSQAGGGSWRASWRRRGPGLGCIAAQRRSRLSGRAGGRHPEGCTEAETSHTPTSARARSTPAPSAPGRPNREKGSVWGWMSGFKQLLKEAVAVSSCIVCVWKENTRYCRRSVAASLWSAMDSQMFGTEVRL